MKYVKFMALSVGLLLACAFQTRATYEVTEKLKAYADHIKYPITGEGLSELFVSLDTEMTSLAEAIMPYLDVEEKVFESVNRAYESHIKGVMSKSEDKENERILELLRKGGVDLALVESGAPLDFSKEASGYFFYESKFSVSGVLPESANEVQERLSDTLGLFRWDASALQPPFSKMDVNMQDDLKADLAKIPEKSSSGKWSLPAFLAHFYKVHLMPKPEHVLDTVYAVFKAFSTGELGKYVKNMKISVRFAPVKVGGGMTPVIVLYVLPSADEKNYKGNAQVVVNELLKVTKPEWGGGIAPRGNAKINDLIFYAQGEGTYKTKYPDGIDQVFQGPNYALYKPSWVDPLDKALDFSLKGA